MAAARRALPVAVAWLLACSSGASSSTTPPIQTFTLSGTIRALAATAVDGDTNDPAAPAVHNDTAATAQALPSIVTVGGWASASADPQDWYRATLAAGQVVTLRIADWTSGGVDDLDLCVYTPGPPPVQVACSAGSGPTESWQATSAGTYLVEVLARSGASNYVLTLAAGPLAVAAPGILRTDAEFVPGEVLVRFRDAPAATGTAPARGLAARAASVGLEPLSGEEGRELRLGLGSGAARDRAFAKLGVPARERDLAAEALDPLAAARADTIDVVKALRRRADVASADPNYVFHPTLTPNDPDYALQWHYPLINLPAAWDVTTGTPPSGQIVVAVVDTGVMLAHPDLAAKLVPGYDFISSVSMSNDGDGIDPNPDDPGDDANITLASFHGTHVAGTVGAATNNGIGVAGVSWGAKIMPIRVLGIGGGTSADINEGLRFAAGLANASGTLPAQRADVVNMSFGCTNCQSATDQAVIDEVRAAGVVLVAAAGNDNTSTLSYPASYTGVLSVSAVGPGGTKASYSSFGTAVALAAPGGETDLSTHEIASTWVQGTIDTRTGRPVRTPVYAWLAGTSMASPHVAGVIALMKAACASLTPAQVDAFLAAGLMTSDKGTPGWDPIYGWGLVDAQKAVSTAKSRCGAPALGVSPAYLDFPPAATSLALTPSLAGAATLTGAITAASDASWLALAAPGGDGLGAWSATVSRGSLAAGAYSATITFTAPLASGSLTARVPVTMQVGGAAGAAGDAGFLHVRVLDASSRVVAQAGLSASAGAYAYSFPGLAAGSYTVAAGTDMDGDGAICDKGEACGAYPARAAAASVNLSADTSGIDFTVGFDVGLGVAGAGQATPAGATEAVP
jgi:serine protease